MLSWCTVTLYTIIGTLQNVDHQVICLIETPSSVFRTEKMPHQSYNKMAYCMVQSFRALLCMKYDKIPTCRS
jgi:hypothetical protein